MSPDRYTGPSKIRGWLSILDDRGVSDVVGYVLVFALVTATITSVFAIGMGGIEDRRDAERVENVERAFDVLDDNLRDLERYGDPSRATEVRLSGGELSLSSKTNVTIEQVDDNGTRISENVTEVNSSAVTYTRGETTIGYDMGARFRTDGDTTLFRSEPRFVSAEGEPNRTVIPIVRTRPGDGPETATGDGTVQISASVGEVKRFEYPEDGIDPDEIDEIDEIGEIRIRIRIESPRADAWERYLDDTEEVFSNVSADENEVVATVDRDEAVYVRVIVVNVSYRR
ncbi:MULTISPECIES: DUF7289 family protein [Haloferacaceae]|uniref:Flagellin n=1 Tax=Halorubrum glutamatedens TaxID=2707018 RepID=A0ABD5QVP9_9EURY|nr:hypothetical protein [Halobellus captivus]